MESLIHPLIAREAERHWWYTGRQRIFKRLFDFNIPKSHLAILDVGCGVGSMCSFLRTYGEVYGVDSSPEALQYAASRGYRSTALASGTKLPYSDGFFDVVVAIDVIEHVENEQSFIEELHRVLKPGGIAFIATAAFPFLWSKLDDVAHHHRRYTKGSFLRSVDPRFLEPKVVRYYNIWLFLPIVILRMIEKLIPRTTSTVDLRELHTPPKPINIFLQKLFSSESILLPVPIPFGVSILGLFKKNVHDG